MVSFRQKVFAISILATVPVDAGFRPSLFHVSHKAAYKKEITTTRLQISDTYNSAENRFAKVCAQGFLTGCLAFPLVVGAVSGGGLDYANLDITGQDFSNGKYKGKDFTQVRENFIR